MSNVPRVANVRTRVMRPMPLTLVIVGTVSFVVVYTVMTGTRGGRSTDAEWTDRALPSSPSGFSRSSAVMRTMGPSHVVLACVALLLVAVVWREWRRVTAMAVGILGLLASAQALKSLLPRPVSDSVALPNSFPSGHVAGAAAIGIAMLLLASGRWRWPALAGGAALVALTATSAVSLQWHRPSDAFGAVLLAMSWYGVGLAILRPGAQSSSLGSEQVDRPQAPVHVESKK